jgi:hypothetical protein
MLVSKKYQNIPGWEPNVCRHCGWHPKKFKTDGVLAPW